jgi:L-ascorbate metabolism protein UlaG (beta-lactamase superfamily)
MRRLLTPVLAVLLLAAGTTTAADAKKVILRWHGQSFFDLETPKGARIVFDPHAIEEYGRISLTADLILVSHFHDDHTQIQVVENHEKAKKIPGLKAAGKRMIWNEIDEKFSFKKGEEFKVRSVGTFHDTMQGMERGLNSAFIVEVAGLRIVHLGDLGHSLTKDQIAKIKKNGEVDVLMIPVGGVYTLNGSEAKKVVEQLKPRLYIVPMHHGTKVFKEVLPVDEFIDLDDQEKKQYTVRKEATNQLDIATDAKPDKPAIVVLHFASKQ